MRSGSAGTLSDQQSLAGMVFDATVNRVEVYGLYLQFEHGQALVLIPDVSSMREVNPDPLAR